MTLEAIKTQIIIKILHIKQMTNMHTQKYNKKHTNIITVTTKTYLSSVISVISYP